MTPEPPSVLEFPAWLDGPIAAIRRKALKTGAFPQPRQMRQVPPGEVLVMHSGAEDFGDPGGGTSREGPGAAKARSQRPEGKSKGPAGN